MGVGADKLVELELVTSTDDYLFGTHDEIEVGFIQLYCDSMGRLHKKYHSNSTE